MLVMDDQQPESDRRAWPRVKVDRPCKLYDPRSGKYLAGSTRDLSGGGALIEIDRPLDINPGESLFVGIAQKRRQVLIRAHDMSELRVVRSLRTPSGGTMIAGQWADATVAAMPLRRAA